MPGSGGLSTGDNGGCLYDLRVWLDGVPGELSLALNSRRCDVKWLGQISQAIVFVLVMGCFLSYIVHDTDPPNTDLDVPGQPVASCPRGIA